MIDLKIAIDNRIGGIREDEIKKLEEERQKLDAKIQAMKGE